MPVDSGLPDYVQNSLADGELTMDRILATSQPQDKEKADFTYKHVICLFLISAFHAKSYPLFKHIRQRRPAVLPAIQIYNGNLLCVAEIESLLPWLDSANLNHRASSRKGVSSSIDCATEKSQSALPWKLHTLCITKREPILLRIHSRLPL